MTTPLLDKQIHLRVSREDAIDLENSAKERDISQSELIRAYIREGNAKYDHKHTQLVDQIQHLQLQVNDLSESLRTSNAMSAATLAAIALLNIPRFDCHAADGTERLKGNIKAAISVGSAILEGYRRGAFN